MARRGVLTRPIGNVIVLMPPYCTTPAQVRRMVDSLDEAVAEVFGGSTDLIPEFARERRRMVRCGRVGDNTADFAFPFSTCGLTSAATGFCGDITCPHFVPYT